MAMVRIGMLGLALLMLLTDLSPVKAQSISSTGLTLRQRLDNERSDARRTAGERNLGRSNSAQETRRRLLVRQRDSAIGSQRSVPILPDASRSSVVVNQ